MLISTQLTYKTITIAQKGILMMIIMVCYIMITWMSNSVNNFQKFSCKTFKLFDVFGLNFKANKKPTLIGFVLVF